MTKRQLGILLFAAGAGALLLILAVDLIGKGQFEGIGPVQRLALGAAGLVMLVGVTLLPLGDRPA